MYKGQWFRNRKTGAHVKIVEVIRLQTRDGMIEAYRLQDTEKRSLTAAQINAAYDKITEPIRA